MRLAPNFKGRAHHFVLSVDRDGTACGGWKLILYCCPLGPSLMPRWTNSTPLLALS